MSRSYDLIQTFYVDKNRVNNSSVVYITSVALYFQQKPVYESDLNKPVATKSGIRKPGVSVTLCPVEKEMPSIDKAIVEYTKRVEHENINTSNTAATATVFTFNEPIPVTTDKQYGICIKFDGGDPDFLLWQAKNGENKVGTNIKQNVSSGKTDGNLYIVGNGDRLEAIHDADLTYYVNIAKFTSSSETYKVYNKKYEFLQIDSVSSNSFIAGERVYKNTSPVTGTVAVTANTSNLVGTGTTFTSAFAVGDYIVISGNNSTRNIRVVNSITNATHLTVTEKVTFTNASANVLNTSVGKVVDFNRAIGVLTLKDTNVNTTLTFANSSVLYGELSFASANVANNSKMSIHQFRNQFRYFTPVETSVNTFFNFVENASGTYYANTSRAQEVGYNTQQSVDTYLGEILSSTGEAANTLSNFDGRSFQGTLTFKTDNLYASPYVKKDQLDLMSYYFLFNSNTEATNEILNTGNADAKYISKKVTLAEGQDAEDIRVYVTAFRPANTDVRVFAKIHNTQDPEGFDDKNWTELELIATDNKPIYSNPSNKRDYVELEYKFREYPIGTAITGTVNTTSSSALVNGVSTAFTTDLAAGNLVKIYGSLFPNNYHIGIVNNVVNDTSLYLTKAITNTGAVGTGLTIDKISTYKNQAFTNKDNNNVVRYYNSSGSEFDTYKTFAIKIVMVSDFDYIFPIVDNYRAVALSA
jgi:hypothetical protein